MNKMVISLIPGLIFIIISLQGCQDNILLPEQVNLLQSPKLIFPPNDTVIIGFQLTFCWSPIRNAISYRLQVSTDSQFGNTEYDESGISTTSQYVDFLKFSVKYYWRVCAINKFDTSGWSKTRNFITKSPFPVLINVKPDDGDTIQIRHIELRWIYIDRPTSVVYDVYLGPENPPKTMVSRNQYQNYFMADTLELNTDYYWKVVAKTTKYSIYGQVWKFSTLSIKCPDPPSIDYAGKLYHTIQIGNQCWLQENLDVGVMIQSGDTAKDNGIIEKYCYDNNLVNCEIYGGLYKWNEAMEYSDYKKKGICPAGWHIPTHKDFGTLASAVEGDANTLKAIGQGSGDGAGTNMSGFSALLSGYYLVPYSFIHLGRTTNFMTSSWSSVDGTDFMALYGTSNKIAFIGGIFAEGANSIRCIKD
jgi:uncharacterized protein (TIGR02145 family)